MSQYEEQKARDFVQEAIKQRKTELQGQLDAKVAELKEVQQQLAAPAIQSLLGREKQLCQEMSDLVEQLRLADKVEKPAAKGAGRAFKQGCFSA